MPLTLEPTPLATGTASPAARPLILWHLLSLDAPTVAVLWTWSIARASHIALPAAPLVAMFLAVWILYAADRLLDARLLDRRPNRAELDTLEPRHLFHHRHRRRFLVGIAFASLALAALLPHLDPGAIRLYLTEATLLAAWFLILHATGSAHRLPKELAVGLFFSAAVFIPTVARQPNLRLTLLPLAALFAALCCLNCLFIYAWENDRGGWPMHDGRDVGIESGSGSGSRGGSGSGSQTRSGAGSMGSAHLSTRLALRYLLPIALATAALAVTLAALAPLSASLRTIPAACSLATLLLLLLHRSRRILAPTLLRACADLALLTPILLLPWTR